MDKPKPIVDNTLIDEQIRHGFFTRDGGVSEGIYRGLNVGLGSDDERTRVLENRSRVAGYFSQPDTRLMTPYQIHSSTALEVIGPWEEGERPQVDALVTSNPNVVIGILTADCGPVLFADPDNGVVGAAHAGWKGATGGVLENTITAMEKMGAQRQNIRAVLGPTISQKAYEVGPEFVERLTALDTENDQFLVPSVKSDHAMFDLPAYIVGRLKAAGINASWTGNCTYDDEASFFSYRRKTHRGEPDYGRQIAAISLNP